MFPSGDVRVSDEEGTPAQLVLPVLGLVRPPGAAPGRAGAHARAAGRRRAAQPVRAAGEYMLVCYARLLVRPTKNTHIIYLYQVLVE